MRVRVWVRVRVGVRARVRVRVGVGVGVRVMVRLRVRVLLHHLPGVRVRVDDVRLVREELAEERLVRVVVRVRCWDQG